MKIKLQPEKETLEMIRDMASKDRETAMNAREAFAEFVRDPVLTVIQQGSVWGSVFEDFSFDKYGGPKTVPFDDFFDVKEVDYIRVWSSPVAGGTPTQQGHGIGEIPFQTYTLNSALSFQLRQLRHGRIDHVSRQLTRGAGEVLVKQERNRALVLLTALANASTDVYAGPGGSNPASLKHVIRVNTAGQLNLQDYNALRTRHRRIMSSWAGGTPDIDQGRGLTDLFMSPEIVEFLRNLAFEPMNLRAGPAGSEGTPAGSNVGIPGTNEMRNAIYNSAGVPSFFGVMIHECLELGSRQRYNFVFDTVAGATSYAKADGTSGAAFDGTGTADEIVVGCDRSFGTLLRPIAVDSDVNSTLTTYPDDTFSRRSQVTGLTMDLEEGNIVLDDRSLSGLVV